MSGAPTGSVVGNASSAAGVGVSGGGFSGSNYGPHSDGGGAGGDGFDGNGDKNDVESILLPNKHSWWNVIALCKKVFR